MGLLSDSDFGLGPVNYKKTWILEECPVGACYFNLLSSIKDKFFIIEHNLEFHTLSGIHQVLPCYFTQQKTKMQLCKYRSSLIKSSVTIKSKHKRFGILDCMYICMYRQENTKTMTLYLMLALCLHQILAQNFVNQYDGVLDFRCPQGKKTRLTKNCASWSILFFLRQTLLRLFSFLGKYISKMYSVHNSHHEDRRFAFECRSGKC